MKNLIQLNCNIKKNKKKKNIKIASFIIYLHFDGIIGCV